MRPGEILEAFFGGVLILAFAYLLMVVVLVVWQ